LLPRFLGQNFVRGPDNGQLTQVCATMATAQMLLEAVNDRQRFTTTMTGFLQPTTMFQAGNDRL
jgi:hypothetical protein